MERKSNAWLVLFTLALGFIMATLDVSISNVAVTTIQNALDLTASAGSWILDSYMLSFASLLFLGGSLANRYGSKNIYLVGLAIFTGASLFSGLAQSSFALIVARFFQGAGSAMFMPASMSLLVSAFPDKKTQAMMFGIWSAIVSVASGVGPFVGGLLVGTLGWRSIFLINVPIGTLGLLLTIPVVKVTKKLSGTTLNVAQNIAGMLMLGGFSYALIEGSDQGFEKFDVILALAFMIVGFISFTLYETKGTRPIVPREVFTIKPFIIANLVGFLLNLALFGGLFMFGLYLQQVLHSNAILAGIQLLPMMIVFVVGNIIFSKITKKFGIIKPLFLGLSLAAITSGGLALSVFTRNYALLAILYALGNLGIGIAVPAMTTLTMQSAGKEYSNIASTMLNVARQIGSLVGVAVLGITFYLFSNKLQTSSLSFSIMALSYFIAVVLVVKIRADV